MKTSEETKDIVAALVVAQSKFASAKKDSENPHFRSKYADYASTWAAVRGPLADHGLLLTQEVTMAERGVSVLTRVSHTSGQWMEYGPLTVPIGQPTAQGVGSAITYGRRYALSAALGVVADDDDDGNAATAAAQAPAAPRATAEEQDGARARIFDGRPSGGGWSGRAVKEMGRAPLSDEVVRKTAQYAAAAMSTGDAHEPTAWMDDKKGRFKKGDPLSSISMDGLKFLRWLLDNGTKSPKYADMDAKRSAEVDAELAKRGA